MRGLFLVSLALFSLLFLAAAFGRGPFPGGRKASAREEYARQTNLPCLACHQGAWGGDLNPLGIAYRDSGYRWPLPAEVRKPLLSLPDPLRIGLRWLHLLAIVLWIGAIMVVHLILGPRIVSRGIPGTFLRIGWPSMGVVFLTGSLLALGRLSSPGDLVSGRWGVVLLAKVGLFTSMVSLAAYETLFISRRLRRIARGEVTVLDESLLARGTGEEGRPVYIGYKGKAYDLSASPSWRRGLHMGAHRAGSDLTRAMEEAPHGDEMLAHFPTMERSAENPLYIKLMARAQKIAMAVLIMAVLALFSVAFWT